ncbi:hypothetical protein SAMN05421539_107125 [Jannaschia seohaensis]|uniref:Uncharacterized protein n=1 Tax=Jannaschia seohaensis TaxID=475081 RepID=A0A2Y9B1Z0_9RHOB|nr:hypothetical protein BCF38_107125 [Jannaschia seohaensis]SSA48349.1 hypothetical protein SAMN05421539_107125 [Jannaschia seohaensis]
MTRDIDSFLKARTEALVKDIGVEAACAATGKSKATIGRYYSTHAEHATRFMPVDAVARLEAAASHPHVTLALLELAQSDALGGRLDRLAAAMPEAPELETIRAALDAMESQLRRDRTG